MIPPKGATSEATLRFFKEKKGRVHADKIRRLQNLSVSAVAVGTYLGDYDDETDRLYAEAITLALTSGVNFLDTAINYRCQRSERVIGTVLRKLTEKKKLSRAEVVVATKGGFIPFDGAPPANLKGYVEEKWIKGEGIPADEIVAGCHCLHPAFLRKQIDGSLANLGIDTVDVYYLHNPETQLPVIGVPLFEKRLIGALEVLEENVSKGRIQYYGLATWTGFREPAGVAEALSLERMMALARQVGGDDHRLKVIQLPYNFAMLEAGSVHGQVFQGKGYPILSAASFHGLSVMISAPLLQGQVLHLPPKIAQKIPGGSSMAQKALQFVSSTPSVTGALVGMKTATHVGENLQVLGLPNWDLGTLRNICDLLVKQE